MPLSTVFCLYRGGQFYLLEDLCMIVNIEPRHLHVITHGSCRGCNRMVV
jgi:hypothetical protein